MYRLIYTSRSNEKITWEMVKDIMHKSDEQNAEKGLTGVLLATRHSFLQVLEGPYETVNDTFMRIVRDPRHQDIKLVCFHTIDARLFEAWGMLGIGVFNLNREIERELMEKYGEQDDTVRFPLEEWKALAMVNDIKLLSDVPSWKK